MAIIIPIQKAAAVNPLKSSQPLGAAFAFLGIESAMPLFHGSQGCTSFALVLFVRHFKEPIPLQTTAMDEVATILGGADHLEEALLNLKARTNPKLIGICTTALVETRGEDFAGDLAMIKEKRKAELAGTEIVLVQTPDFDGAIEEGWSKAVTSLIEALVPAGKPRDPIGGRVNILPGWNLTVADIELLRETVESLFAGMQARLQQVEALGIDRRAILRQSFITPSCGVGSLSLELARRVLALTKELSAKMREEL